MASVRLLATLFLLLSLKGTFSLFYQARPSGGQYQCLPGLTLSQLSNLTVTMADMTRFYDHCLNRILVPRIPDTPSHAIVRQFIEDHMRGLGWTVTLDSFDSSTPFGTKTFTNIIATLNPAATKRIVFACHYDSKVMAGNRPFLGATDSAVPCALLLDTAWKMTEFLQSAQTFVSEDTTPQFIFFDGEEAFVRWTATDSLYGSRHLAQKWGSEPDPNDATAPNNLKNIEFFVLLDLIGSSNLKFANFYYNTSTQFYNMYQIEHCLRNSRILQRRSYQRPIFDLWAPSSDFIEDDHIPFIERGVPILHLISRPFPAVWHTLNDDLHHLDRTVIKEFAAVFRVFIYRLFSGAI